MERYCWNPISAHANKSEIIREFQFEEKNLIEEEMKRRDRGPSCWTDWRWEGGVRLATVRATKRMNSLTLDLWKQPKWLTSKAFANITGSVPSGLHFNTNSAVIFISLSLSLCDCVQLFVTVSLSLSLSLVENENGNGIAERGKGKGKRSRKEGE